MDLEALGGVATGGLVAQAIESPTGHAGEHQTVCADCGTETIGRFCHNCGNTSHVHRTLLHLGEELLHGVMHFDSRTWRTLPMLALRPGQLTREWCLGKRMRYVSPLAVFLFTVFVMFMMLSYLPNPKATLVEQETAAAARLARHRTELADAQVNLGSAITAGMREKAQQEVKRAQAGVDQAGVDLRDLQTAGHMTTDWKESLAQDARRGDLHINTGSKSLDGKIRHKLENPDLAIYKLQQTFYKFSFLLVPISIPFVAVLFLWRRGFTLYDHGVFVLYSLTFMSLLALAAGAAMRIGGGVAALIWTVLPFAVPTHMFFQLKGAYGLSAVSALWRTVVLMTFCAIALCLFIVSVIWLGLG
ncbi:MAG: DUF3667 domain-containing protein [Caulobacterales bacterium]|nr:DUF3667 domain-containing protein [Caulobacterales bacterium]